MENVTQLFLEAEWEYISSNEMYDIYFDISNSLRKKEQELKEREKKDSAQIFGLEVVPHVWTTKSLFISDILL